MPESSDLPLRGGEQAENLAAGHETMGVLLSIGFQKVLCLHMCLGTLVRNHGFKRPKLGSFPSEDSVSQKVG